ncbi:MAG: hypothetical protein ACJ76H_16710, partial [Bacteriovoracaceae bacterium]
MHTLLKVTMTDVQTANTALTSGEFQKILKQVTDLIKPESSFFYSEQGCRAALFIFNMRDVSMIPQIAEPLFIGLNAKVEFIPAMDASELTKGLQVIQKEAPSNLS